MDFKEIRSVRSLFPAAENNVYLESASTGLIPTYIYQAVNDYQNSRYMIGGNSVWGPEQIDSFQMMEQSKQIIARMINCDIADVTFGCNTSDILSFVTSNIAVSKGKNVVIPENLFSSGKYMWQIREIDGLEIRYAPVKNGCIDEDELLTLTDENTLAVHVDLVSSETGYRIDAEKIGNYCRSHGIYFIADAAQCLGALPVDCKAINADLIACNNYKWMLGYGGCGIGYIRKELRDSLTQRSAGWMSDQYRFVCDSERINLRNDADRFMLGYPNVAGIYACGLAAENYMKLEGKVIENYLMHLRNYLEKRVNASQVINMTYDFKDRQKSQVVYLSLKAGVHVTHESLQNAGIFCDVHDINSAGETELRIGLHYYNDEGDIDYFIDTINKLSGGK